MMNARYKGQSNFITSLYEVDIRSYRDCNKINAEWKNVSFLITSIFNEILPPIEIKVAFDIELFCSVIMLQSIILQHRNMHKNGLPYRSQFLDIDFFDRVANTNIYFYFVIHKSICVNTLMSPLALTASNLNGLFHKLAVLRCYKVKCIYKKTCQKL